MEPGGGRCDPRPLTRDEEAVKRNTDCVYFLASPLTCKKGSECEYRHSEAVRVNPRDCKFWFSGNCLNPKCLFRHPPFDGPVGNPVAASGSIMAASQVNTSMLLSMGNSSAYNFSRNNVPCYYFQKGSCLKGDKCPFMHGPQPTATSVANQTAKVSAPVTTQSETTKKDASKLKECSNKQSLSMAAPSLCKESARKPVNGASSLLEGSLTLENANLGEFSGAGHSKLKRPLNQQPQSSRYRNEKGVEEVFREFSPGFDILVNNVVKVADHQAGRNMRHGDGYGHHHRDPESRDQRNGAGEFLHYGKAQNDVDGNRTRASSVSERILDEHILPVRRSAHRRRIPDGVDETDLRHRLMKQRRLNSSLSATISDPESKAYSRHELKMQNRRKHNPYRDQRQLLTEITGSSRLRDRITVSKPLSQEFPSDLHGGGRGRQRGDLSPMRTSNLQRRLGERLSRRVAEDSSGNARRDSVDPLDFAGPRSLAELKGAKTDEISRVRSNKNILSSMEHRGTKPLKAAGPRDSEISAVFDGPKPLSTLLNRKTEARSENDAISVVSNPEQQGDEVFISNPEEPEIGTAVEEEGEIEEEVVHIPADGGPITYEQQVAEDETEARDAAEDEEIDYTDQLDGEYDYETVDGGDYKTEDDENMDPMNIDDDEEDEDDFAKNIGLILS